VTEEELKQAEIGSGIAATAVIDAEGVKTHVRMIDQKPMSVDSALHVQSNLVSAVVAASVQLLMQADPNNKLSTKEAASILLPLFLTAVTDGLDGDGSGKIVTGDVATTPPPDELRKRN